MPFAYSPYTGGSAGTNVTSSDTAVVGGNKLWNPGTGTVVPASSSTTLQSSSPLPVSYGYLSNTGTIVRNANPVNVDANGNVYDTGTGNVLAGPQAGTSSGTVAPSSGCATCDQATALVGQYWWVILAVVILALVVMFL